MDKLVIGWGIVIWLGGFWRIQGMERVETGS